MNTQRDQALASQLAASSISSAIEPKSPYVLEGADRVLRMLDAFSTETPELRLTDLSERLGIPKSQALRIATTLEQSNYLTRDPETKRYRLGMRLFSLGIVVEQTLNLKRIAQTAFQELADVTKETVGLFVADRDGAICVDTRESPKGLRVFGQIGRRMPWNAGASGKVALAFLPEHERQEILNRNAFRRYTDRTITDPDILRGLLGQIRDSGYHVGVGDLDEDVLGIGAPIFSHTGNLTGAISLSAPIARAPDSELPRLIDLVTGAASAISRQLGFDAAEPRRHIAD
ncbi:MAG: IclR family transcriptional regulator [Thermomicrobiales bacterium]